MFIIASDRYASDFVYRRIPCSRLWLNVDLNCRSPSLIAIATQHHPHSAIVADILNLPHSSHTFDFALSIAVLHHLSARQRRVEAIKEILRALKSPQANAQTGQALIFVWALEQKNSRRGWDKGDEQDVLVPWVLKPDRTATDAQPKTYQRYYHLYEQGEIEREATAAGAEVVKSGYDRDNWWVIIEPKS